MQEKNIKYKKLNSKKLVSFFMLHTSCRRGFTLVELLVAMAIFSIIALASVAAFGSSMQSQRKTREIQSNVAAAKTAMDLMAKTMRMSRKLAGDEKEIHMYNSSQGICLSYKFPTGGNLEIAEKTGSSDNCGGAYNDYVPIIPGASGGFRIVETDDSGSKTIGKVTILVIIGDDHLQTSVSFRDYVNIVQ